jgi:hypothetical protein
LKALADIVFMSIGTAQRAAAEIVVAIFVKFFFIVISILC